MKPLWNAAWAVLLSACLVIPAAAEMFFDVPEDHWANPSIEAMAQRGLIRGVGEGRFSPDDNLSTAQFAVMLTQAFCPEELPAAAAAADQPWWEPYVTAAWQAGYLTDTTAAWSYLERGSWDRAVLDAPMTRFDMAQAMHNTVLAEGLPLPSDEARAEAITRIGDFDSISEDYETAVVAMYALNLLSGVNAEGDFSGTSPMTRAEACIVLEGLLNLSVSPEESPSQTSELAP